MQGLKGLAYLLKAKKKAIVNELFVYTFENRNSSADNHVEHISEQLGINEEESEQLFTAMQKLIKECIFENYSDQEVNAALSRIPSFNTDLAKLITSIVSHHLPNWRREVKSHQISLPKLEEFDWRVDIKSASDLIGQISVPTVLVAMKVNDELNEKKTSQIVNFELSKESLSAMLEGLGKIRDQLNSVSSRS